MSPIEYMMYIKKKSAIDAKRIAPSVDQEKEKRKIKKILDEFQIMEGIQREPYTKVEKQLLKVSDVEDE